MLEIILETVSCESDSPWSAVLCRSVIESSLSVPHHYHYWEGGCMGNSRVCIRLSIWDTHKKTGDSNYDVDEHMNAHVNTRAINLIKC